jgi:hypothetical protein
MGASVRLNVTETAQQDESSVLSLARQTLIHDVSGFAKTRQGGACRSPM